MVCLAFITLSDFQDLGTIRRYLCEIKGLQTKLKGMAHILLERLRFPQRPRHQSPSPSSHRRRIRHTKGNRKDYFFLSKRLQHPSQLEAYYSESRKVCHWQYRCWYVYCWSTCFWNSCQRRLPCPSFWSRCWTWNIFSTSCGSSRSKDWGCLRSAYAYSRRKSWKFYHLQLVIEWIRCIRIWIRIQFEQSRSIGHVRNAIWWFC